MLSNTSGIAEVWKRLIHKYEMMYNKRAFCHWYTQEGLDFQEFEDARMNIATLAQEYMDINYDLTI